VGAVLTLSPTLSQGRGSPPGSLAWLVWGLGAALYLIAFYQRVAPAVITAELSREFGLSAAALGNLSAFYFYSYAAVQIPTGLLADRWGPRKVLATGAALTALGTLVFAWSPSVAYANAGRLAIGAAAGVAFVSMLKLASHWMAPQRFAFVSGLALLIGTLGATLAGAPLRIAVDAFGWRAVMLASAIVTAILCVAIWIVVRDDPADRGYDGYFPHESLKGTPSIGAQLAEVFRFRNPWLMLVVPGGFTAILLTFPGLWGVPFLVSQYGFSTRDAALTASAMLVAWAIGSVFFGPLSERLRRRKPVMASTLAVVLALWSIVTFVPGLPRIALVALLIAASLAGGGFILVFAFAKESVPLQVAGTASGIANMGTMLGGMVMQPVVGIILDRQWRGTMRDGVRLYDFDAYQAAFATMLVWGVVALALLALARETHCRSEVTA
jgi:sugar phosphate permease